MASLRTIGHQWFGSPAACIRVCLAAFVLSLPRRFSLSTKFYHTSVPPSRPSGPSMDPPTKSIYCLPVEMLSLIFKLAVYQRIVRPIPQLHLKHKCKKRPKEARNPTLLHITHVCVLWRDTAINDSSLWSHIDFASPQRTLVFLERARASSLRVSLNTPRLSSNFIEATGVFCGNKNIQGLELDADFRTISSTVSHMQKASFRAPRLRMLSICSAECFYDVETALAFFVEIVPEVQMLKLMHCKITWPSEIFGGLRQLQIIHSPLMCSIRDFADLLSQMLNLTHLEVNASLPRTASHLYYPQKSTFKLASLEYLYVGDTAQAVAQFICSVQLPEIIDVLLAATANDSPQPYVFAIARRLADLFDPASSPDRANMRLTEGPNRLRFQLQGSGHVARNAGLVILANRSLHPLLAPVAEIMAIPQLSYFCCDITSFSAEDWLLAFGHLENLRKIQLPRNALTSLMVALFLMRNNGDGTTGISFPALQTIVVAKDQRRTTSTSNLAALAPQTLSYRATKFDAPISLICQRVSDSDPFLDYLKTENVPHVELPYVFTM
ncbi:hypothetical protein BDN71DRAFT_1456180 [Pleurotus eryngii]|uniref:F-box domain-containing protein n=1 Tax=Pleurotus eryngii TaxID=5323 RepID=A0A9P5ZKF6_PLEER|nr:hypothetical protein BDN71DRAFT_1456180 [Pleurotus eryngii]